jgi:hypothetical protein
MLIPEGDGSLQTHLSIWERFDRLSEEVRDILTSEEIAWKMQEIQETFKLNEAGIAAIGLLVRKIFFQELNISEAEAKIHSMLAATGGEDSHQANAIVEFIQKEILTIKPVKEVISDTSVSSESVIKTVRLPLLKAMSEYRHLSEQLLTNEKIKLKTSMEPVRPSLGNWLRSYREELGIGFHETAQRGSFLFQSQNGKRLSNGERARLNLILKSVEEEYPLEIDIAHETIIFPPSGDASMELTQVKAQPMNPIIRPRGLPTDLKSMNPNAKSAVPAVVPDTQKPAVTQSFKPFFKKVAPPEKNVSGKTLHFSTGHVLPAEREAGALPQGVNEALRQMQQPTQGIRREPRSQSTNSPYSIRPLRSRNEGNGDI